MAECLGGRLKVRRQVAAHGPGLRTSPGKGAPASPVHRPLGLSKRACSPLQVRRKDRQAWNFLPLPALYRALCSPAKLGGRRPPSALHWPSAPGRHGLPALATATSCGRCGSAVLGRFYTASSTSGTLGLGCRPRQLPSLAFCLLCVLVSTCPCLSQFLSLILDLAYRIRSGFVSRSLSSCFSWDVPASRYFIFSAFSPSYLIIIIFFPLSFASLLSSLLPGHLEHHQLPYSETPCPGENTPALLGTSRPETSFLRAGGDLGMEAECSCLGRRDGAE